MKVVIIFNHMKVALKRKDSSATVTITTIPENSPFPSKIAQLADRLNESKFIDVIQIFPGRGKIDFKVTEGTRNEDVMDAVLDSITYNYNTDTVVPYERP